MKKRLEFCSQEDPALSATTLWTIESWFGFETMTPVQAACIPLMLKHRDVVAEACTGSGKTLAFVVAAIELVLRARRDEPTSSTFPRCVAVSPTRELAIQTERVFAPLCEAHGLGAPALATGGVAMTRDIVANVVVGTPGRLDDVLRKDRGEPMVSKYVALLVLDEADTLLDLGFADELRRIAHALPKQRRTALFSATQTRAVAELARAGLRNPASVRVKVAHNDEGGSKDGASLAPRKTPSELKNKYVVVREDEKLALLFEVLRRHSASGDGRKILVFFNTCAAVDFFGHSMEAMMAGLEDVSGPKKELVAGLPLFFALHGKMQPKKRRAVFDRFRAQPGACLLCTDVAARGLDVSDVGLVVQFDAPTKPDTFVHRAGRTARAGASGCSLLFLADHEDAFVQLMALRGAPLDEATAAAFILTPLDKKEDDPAAYLLATRSARLRAELEDGCVRDRALLEKGTRAFTAHVKAYGEHRLQFIFRFDRVDLAATARLYALLKLPEMPELRKAVRLGRLKEDDFLRKDVRTGTIAFADPKREKARLARLDKSKQERLEKKAEMIAAARDAPALVKKQKPKADEPRKRTKKQGRNAQILAEWDELAHEELLAKKLRKGKMSRAEYDAALAGLDGGDDSDTKGGGGADDDDDYDDDGDDDAPKKKNNKKKPNEADGSLQQRKNFKKQKGALNKRQHRFKGKK